LENRGPSRTPINYLSLASQREGIKGKKPGVRFWRDVKGRVKLRR